MTIENKCYVCGKEGPCIDGLCPDCTMAEFFNPGAAFAATFGALNNGLETAQKQANELSDLYARYRASIDQLQAIAGDFSDGSQQRFMLAMRKANDLRDECWRREKQQFNDPLQGNGE